MHEISTMTPDFFSITVSPMNAFLWNCCNMMQVWLAITEAESDADVELLRSYPGYTHHFSFLYRLPRPDNLDNKLIATAIECAQINAIELDVWDGGKSIWESWHFLREDVISETSDEDILEWKEKYLLIKPEIFEADTDTINIIKNLLRLHADIYMRQVFTHLTTI
jgi:hypothetical protein